MYCDITYYDTIQDSSKGGAVEIGCSDLYMMLCTSLLYNTTPIHCTPLPLHPPLRNVEPYDMFNITMMEWEVLRDSQRPRLPKTGSFMNVYHIIAMIIYIYIYTYTHTHTYTYTYTPLCIYIYIYDCE